MAEAVSVILLQGCVLLSSNVIDFRCLSGYYSHSSFNWDAHSDKSYTQMALDLKKYSMHKLITFYRLQTLVLALCKYLMGFLHILLRKPKYVLKNMKHILSDLYVISLTIFYLFSASLKFILFKIHLFVLI